MTDGRTDGRAIAYSALSMLSRAKNRITTFCRVPHGELTAKKWLDFVEKQKRSNLKERDRQRDILTDRQRQFDNNNTPRLVADIKNGVSTFTPRSIHISNAMFTCSLAQPAIGHQPSQPIAAVQYGTKQWRVCYYSSIRL